MKKNLIFVFCFVYSLQICAQYIENFHECATSFQGYWSCEKRNGHDLIDISGKNNHGFYKNVFHEKGRQGRLYSNGKAFIDSTGITRTCLTLNGGYAQVNGICFECDSARYNKLIKFQAYIKRDSNSYGVIASFGDSVKGNGVLIYNSLDSFTFSDSLTVKILSNNNTVKYLTGFLPPNRWFYLKIYIALNKSNPNSVDHIFGQILEDDSGNSDISNYPSSLNNDAIPDLGW